MEIQPLRRTSSSHIYRVSLTEEELKWSDSRIITATDRYGNLSDEEWESIRVGDSHPGHFGGTVNRMSDNMAEVKVYVD